jgi:ABC-type glutathione transport system ATPase component
MSPPILTLRDIDLTYRRAGRSFQALKAVTVEIMPGECVGIVGESGSGKSTLAMIAAGLLRPTSGQIEIDGTTLPQDSARRPLALRRTLQIVFQDPYGSLDPTFGLEQIVAEGPAIHRLGTQGEQRARARAALAEVGLGEAFIHRRPSQLSGGQRQRAAIARALAVDPQLVILDEPTSALDLSVQAQILNLLLDLQLRRGLSYLFISHDIDVIRHLAHRVYVMRDGEIVESGPTGIVLRDPSHPYTRRLVDAVPSIRFDP